MGREKPIVLLSGWKSEQEEYCKNILTRETPVTLLMREGFATARPEAALVTETAGVSTPSAMVNPVAKRH